MELPPLVNGRIQRRYKRFLADVTLDDGREVVAHCPNTGSMTGCWAPGAPVQLSHSDNPKRKLAWTLERVDMGGGWIGVHTGRTNPVVEEALRAGSVKGIDDYLRVTPEVTLDLPGHTRSRLDFRLAAASKPDLWIEVKNTTLLTGNRVRFPDAVTARGRKHLTLLAELVARGERGMILFAVNRPEGDGFEVAAEIDPDYATTLAEVMAQGVEAIAVRINHHATGMQIHDRVPLCCESPWL
ncbi:MAG: DNA/RNA nuclease SfsA [Gammaproteobacteria bacterium]|nr:DNA/RNA nuclease SfsA [Gammaproteobacteria bacterium]